MNLIARWWRFSLVGMMGTAVQLAVLAVLNRWTPGHYLYTSTAAIELALLHNFIWHLHFTWRDRRDSAARLRQLLRFHLANGLISMTGNLIVMRLLVGGAHLPVLLSNVIAILVCAMGNYYASHYWVFAPAAAACMPFFR